MISYNEQLKGRGNFESNGKLFLVRCQNCGNKENYLPAVATGQCAWCGWPNKEE